MKVKSRLKWFFLLLIILLIGIVLDHFYDQLGEFLRTHSSALLPTGTLLRNIGMALFAISAWYSQYQFKRTNQLLNTFDLNTAEVGALQVAITIRDIEGLRRLQVVNTESAELIKRKIEGLIWTDRFRNMAIVLFVVGVSVELFEVASMWLQ